MSNILRIGASNAATQSPVRVPSAEAAFGDLKCLNIVAVKSVVCDERRAAVPTIDLESPFLRVLRFGHPVPI